MRVAGAECLELLLSGQEVSDELYVKLFITKLRSSYKYKDPKTKRKELKERARK